MISVCAAVLGGTAAPWVTRGLQGLLSHPRLAVTEITVSGTQHLDDGSVLARAGIVPGDRWLQLDTAGAVLRIESIPGVERARVRRPWIGRVRLEVVECQVLAHVVFDRHAYGLCSNLHVLPREFSGGIGLPVIRRAPDEEALARALEYVTALGEVGICGSDRIELTLSRRVPDVIHLVERGFSASVEERIAPKSVIRNLAAFLETLDEKGGSRGTLRLISEGTAVWASAA